MQNGLNVNDQNNSSLKEMLKTKYTSSCNNLLFVVAFTVINIVLLVTNSNTYFLFSAYIPYALVDLGMFLCGRYPQELYTDFGNMEFVDNSFFATTVVIAAIIVLVYFLSWLFSKKGKVGWLIASLVLFAIDSVAMLIYLGFSTEIIIDIVVHIWVIVSLSIGISNYYRLKKLPEYLLAVQFDEDVENTDAQHMADQPSEQKQLNKDDFSVKYKILAQGDVLGHTVIYRRVKRTNELIVDGIVYDELEALVETAHTLTAEIDGHIITAGYDGKFNSFIKIGNELVTKKLRLF